MGDSLGMAERASPERAVRWLPYACGCAGSPCEGGGRGGDVSRGMSMRQIAAELGYGPNSARPRSPRRSGSLLGPDDYRYRANMRAVGGNAARRLRTTAARRTGRAASRGDGQKLLHGRVRLQPGYDIPPVPQLERLALRLADDADGLREPARRSPPQQRMSIYRRAWLAAEPADVGGGEDVLGPEPRARRVRHSRPSCSGQPREGDPTRQRRSRPAPRAAATRQNGRGGTLRPRTSSRRRAARRRSSRHRAGRQRAAVRVFCSQQHHGHEDDDPPQQRSEHEAEQNAGREATTIARLDALARLPPFELGSG
jgi:hypothetical protein